MDIAPLIAPAPDRLAGIRAIDPVDAPIFPPVTNPVAAPAGSAIVALSPLGQFLSALTLLQNKLAQLQGDVPDPASPSSATPPSASLSGAAQDLLDAFKQIQIGNIANFPPASDTLAMLSLNADFTQALGQQMTEAFGNGAATATPLPQVGLDALPMAPDSDMPAFQSAIDSGQAGTLSQLASAVNALKATVLTFAAQIESLAPAVPNIVAALPSILPIAVAGTGPAAVSGTGTVDPDIVAAISAAQHAQEDLSLREAVAASQGAAELNSATNPAANGTAAIAAAPSGPNIPATPVAAPGTAGLDAAAIAAQHVQQELALAYASSLLLSTAAPAPNPVTPVAIDDTGTMSNNLSAAAAPNTPNTPDVPAMVDEPALSVMQAAPASVSIPDANSTSASVPGTFAAPPSAPAVAENGPVLDQALASAIAAYHLGDSTFGGVANATKEIARPVADPIGTVAPVTAVNPFKSRK